MSAVCQVPAEERPQACRACPLSSICVDGFVPTVLESGDEEFVRTAASYIGLQAVRVQGDRFELR